MQYFCSSHLSFILLRPPHIIEPVLTIGSQQPLSTLVQTLSRQLPRSLPSPAHNQATPTLLHCLINHTTQALTLPPHPDTPPEPLLTRILWQPWRPTGSVEAYVDGQWAKSTWCNGRMRGVVGVGRVGMEKWKELERAVDLKYQDVHL